MHNDRKIFIRQLFHFLAGKDYLWLKAIFDNPTHVPPESDIDLFVKEDDLGEISAFIARQPQLVHLKMEDMGTVVFHHLIFADGSFLKLDLLTRLVRKQWTYLTEDYLFDNRIWKNGIATYLPEILLEHVLLFNFLNHSGLPKKYIGYFSSLPEEELGFLLFYVNRKYGTEFTTLDDMAKYSPEVRRAFLFFLGKIKENTLTKRFETGLVFLRSKIKSWKRLPAEVITFSGVDGAGKTTILHDLRRTLHQKLGRRVVVLRHRPGLLPILSAWTQGKAAAEKKAAENLPRQGKNRNKLSSVFRFAYYFTDYLVGQFYVWLRYTLLGYVVIYDRYYFDFIVDGKRSNISLGERLPKWLFRFVFKPRLNVFLYAPPAVIRQRKKEMPAADIEQLTERYLALFAGFSKKYEGEFLCLENIDRAETLGVILSRFGNLQGFKNLGGLNGANLGGFKNLQGLKEAPC